MTGFVQTLLLLGGGGQILPVQFLLPQTKRELDLPSGSEGSLLDVR